MWHLLFLTLVKATYIPHPGGLCVDKMSEYTCAIDPSGESVECWGGEDFDVFMKDAPFTQITCGQNFVCGIRAAESNKESRGPRLEPDYHEKELNCWGPDADAGMERLSGVHRNIKFKHVSAGWDKVCGVTVDGDIKCSNVESDPKPWPQGKYKEVAVGVDFTCAIVETTRTVKCWGTEESIAKTVPADLQTSAFKTIVAGSAHICGILDSGILKCWGEGPGATIPASATDVKFSSISCGYEYTCGVNAETSKAICWGLEQMDKFPPPTDVTFHQVHIGWQHVCGIKTDRHVMCWGYEKPLEDGAEEFDEGESLLTPYPDISYGFLISATETSVAMTLASETRESPFLPAAMFLAGFTFMFVLNRLCQPPKEASLEVSFLELE